MGKVEGLWYIVIFFCLQYITSSLNILGTVVLWRGHDLSDEIFRVLKLGYYFTSYQKMGFERLTKLNRGTEDKTSQL